MRTLMLALLLVLASSVALAQPQIPPDIQALMNKAARGEALTAAEMQRLQEWGAAMAGAGVPSMPPKGGAGPKGSKEALVAQGAPDLGGLTVEMFCKPKPAITASTPSDAAYGKLLGQLAATYGKKAGAENAAVTKALTGAKEDADGANLGVALFLQNHHAAAVLATVWSVRRQPRDPVFAANLGAILDADGDDKTALQVLLYAAAQSPKFELVQSNLGWVHAAHGNRAAAKSAFEIATNSGFPSAHIGLGQLAMCNDEWPEAERQFNLALSSRYSSIAEAGIDKAQQRREHEQEQEQQREPDPRRRRAPTPPPAPPRDLYPPKLEGLRLTDPPFGATARIFAMNVDVGRKYFEQWGNLTPLVEQARTLQSKVMQKGAPKPPVFAGNKMSVFANQDRHGKAWRDAQARFQMRQAYLLDRLRAGHVPLMDDVQRRSAVLAKQEQVEHDACGSSRPCNARVTAEYCRKFVALADYAFAAYVPIWGAFWPSWRAAFEELWAQSNAVISMTTDPDWVALYSVERKMILWQTLGQTTTLLETMRGMIAGMIQKDCPPPPQETTLAPSVTPDGKPAECHWAQNGSVKLDFDVAVVKAAGIELSFDCDDAKIEISIGPGRWAVSRDFKSRNVTIFSGVGAGLDAPTGLGGEVKSQWFVTFEGSTPVDAGAVASGAGYVGGYKREYTGKIGIATDAGIEPSDFVGFEGHVPDVGGVGVWKQVP